MLQETVEDVIHDEMLVEEKGNYAAIEIERWKALIKKHEKCRMLVKKYEVKKVTKVDRILHRVNVENSVHYLTEGPRGKSMKDDYKPCEFPEAFVDRSLDTNDITATFTDIVKNEQDIVKDKYSDMKPVCGIRRRIFVPDGEQECVKGIKDVDEKYFSIVQKRRSKWALGVRSYLNYLRESLRLRLQTGYVFDEIYKINEQEEIESYKLEQIRSRLKDFRVTFDEFLAEDHKESMKPLLIYADELAETEKTRHELKKNNTEVVKLRFDIYELEDAWRKSQLCEEFLLIFFAILSGNHSTYFIELKYGVAGSGDSVSERLDYSESLASLMQFISPKVVDNDAFDVHLNDPSYLLEVFRSLEHQCLDYLTFTEVLEKPNDLISTNIDLITQVYGIEIDSIKQTVSKLNNLIKFIENNNERLKTHVNDLLYGLFRDTFPGAEESIIVNEYIKQTYTKCITGSETSVTSYQMMDALATEYQHILLEMDSLPTGLLRKFVKEVEDRENAKLVIARDARRRLHELEILTEQMSRLFKPVLIAKSRKLMYRSHPPITKEVPPPEPVEVTEQQKEYLYLFTDFCPYSDDAEFYLSKINEHSRLSIRRDSIF